MASPAESKVSPPRAAGLDRWNTINIQAQDIATAEACQRRLMADIENLKQRGLTIDQAQPPIQDKWKPVTFSDDGKRVYTKSQILSQPVETPYRTASPLPPADPGRPVDDGDSGDCLGVSPLNSAMPRIVEQDKGMETEACDTSITLAASSTALSTAVTTPLSESRHDWDKKLDEFFNHGKPSYVRWFLLWSSPLSTSAC